METGSISKAASPTGLVGTVRVESAAQKSAAPASLPPEKSVRQPSSTDAVRVSIDDSAQKRAEIDQAIQEVVRRNVTIDPATREVVYQVVDEATGTVVRQLPDETLLKLRTLAREMREKAQAERGPDDAPTIERIA